MKFQNNIGRNLQICIEPLLDYIDWEIGKRVTVEFKRMSCDINWDIYISLEHLFLMIYQDLGFSIRISIDEQLVYLTPQEWYL